MSDKKTNSIVLFRNNPIISIDVESDGLYGQCLAIAAVVRDVGKTEDTFLARVGGTYTIKDKWVAKHIIPKIVCIPVTHDNSEAMEEAFWSFWLKWRGQATAIGYCSSTIEAALFNRCVMRNVEERNFQGPYLLHDVATLLHVTGHDSLLIEKFIHDKGIKVDHDGGPHHPMYDCLAAATVWEYFCK